MFIKSKTKAYIKTKEIETEGIMEYTKDMILQVRYGEKRSTIKNKKEKRTSRLWEGIQKHKVLTATIISMLAFISIDIVLVSNFVRILSLI